MLLQSSAGQGVLLKRSIQQEPRSWTITALSRDNTLFVTGHAPAVSLKAELYGQAPNTGLSRARREVTVPHFDRSIP